MIFINANIYGEMAYYSRYRRRTGSARYRRRYYRRRYYRRRTAGSISTRSRVRIRVPAQRVVTLTIPAKSTDSDIATANPYWESLDDKPTSCCSAVGMPLYQAYCGLFDQVKCDGVITKVAVVSPIGGGAGAALQALQLLIAYDRQGTRLETANAPAQAGQGPPITVTDLYSMSSVQIRSAINNSVAKTARSCWASDLQERTIFHDCTIAANDVYVYDKDYNSQEHGPPYFVPLTMIGIRNAAAKSESKTTVQILIEQVYYFTFRNPKFGATTTSIPSVPGGAGAKAFAVAEDDPLATESLDSEERVFVRPRSGWTPPKKQPRSTVGAMMEAGLDDPEEVTPYLLESLAEREEAMEDPDYVGNPKGSMDRMKEDERVDLLVNLRKGKRQADRWHARHDGETTLLSPPHDTPRVVPRRKK